MMHIGAFYLSLGVASASFTLQLQRNSPQSAADLIKRGSITLDTAFNASGGGYYAEIEVGTPGQAVKVHLDTGSSDTWVNTAETELCDSTEFTDCDGFFSPKDSLTFQIIDKDGFATAYLDQRTVTGDFANETIAIGGSAVNNQTIGVARNMIPGGGLLALGLRGGSASEANYPTFVDNLAAQGLIGRAAFSLFLNHSDAESASILFGGIDSQKFIGELVTLPIVPAPNGSAVAWSVRMDSVSVSSDNEKRDSGEGLNTTAIMDSGATLTYLPEKVVKPMRDKFEIVTLMGHDFIPCKYRNPDKSKTTVDFVFQNKTVKVPLSELTVEFPDTDLAKLLPIEEPCIFGIQSTDTSNITSDTFAIIGDTVLRSAYVVYDATNKQVGLAQANVGSSESNIHELNELNEGKDFPVVRGVPEEDADSTSGSNGAEPSGEPSSGGGENSAVAMAPCWMMALAGVFAATINL